MSRPLITIFGATGMPGGGLARALLGDPCRPFRVRAVTRQPGGAKAQALAAIGAEIILADWADAVTVQRALHGAHGAFCVTGRREHRSADQELAHAATMAEAARREGVRHIVWFTRRALPPTLLHGGLQCDSPLHACAYSECHADAALALALPIGEWPSPGIAARDIAACAAAVFRHGERWIERSLGSVGEGEEQTGALLVDPSAEAVIGDPHRFLALPPASFAAGGIADGAGLSDMARFIRDLNAAWCAAHSDACRRVVHGGPQSTTTWLVLQGRRPGGPPR